MCAKLQSTFVSDTKNFECFLKIVEEFIAVCCFGLPLLLHIDELHAQMWTTYGC